MRESPLVQRQVEPWLREVDGDVPAVPRGVLHALALAEEDILERAAILTDVEIHAQPYGLTSFAFHVRHISHSLDRLLTYAEGSALNAVQHGALGVELEAGIAKAALLAEFRASLSEAATRIRALPIEQMEQTRFVGGKRLPATLGGLLVHLADHTQRHAGQAVVTAKLLLALR